MNSLSLHYSRVHQNGPFYILLMDYMDTTLSRICPIMGDYLIPIYIQVGSSLSPNIYQESITNIKIVSQQLVFVGFLKLESPPTRESIVLHTSHLPHKPSNKSNHAWFGSLRTNFWPFHQFPTLRSPSLTFKLKNIQVGKSTGAHLLYAQSLCHYAPLYPIWAWFYFVHSFKQSFNFACHRPFFWLCCFNPWWLEL